MELITALGLDNTIWIQLIIFLVAYFALSRLLFAPYLEAFNTRLQLTEGSEEDAEQIVEKTNELQYKYEKHARHINEQIKEIYDKAKLDAYATYDNKVAEARNKSQNFINENRQRIVSEVQHAENELKSEIPNLSKIISQKLVGKEMQQ